MKIIHYTQFLDNPYGNGAEKRASQIRDLLSNCQCDVLNFDELESRNQISKWRKYKLGYDYLQFNKYPLLSKTNIAKQGIEIERIYSKLDSIKGIKSLVFEFSRYSDNKVPYVASLLKVPIIGLPHNLESLVPFQKSLHTKKEGLEWLNEELNLLKFCNAIFTISREENWLLTLLNYKARYLPYFPTLEVEKYYLDIRSKRDVSEKQFFLLLGTVSNPPTRQAFIDLIEYFNDNTLDHVVKICGFETESLKSQIALTNENIELVGSVNQDHLTNLLIHCKGLIINQRPSSGALTKISELQVAGIPTLANALALRSYYNIPGLYSYASLNDLKKLMEADNLYAPDIPFRNKEAADLFLEEVNS